MTAQPTLFRELGDDPRRLVPEGFRYQQEIISEAEEVALAASLTALELKPFEFHGHLGNRRVTSFGLRYDYARRAVEAAQSFPAFVTELRSKVAKFAGREVEKFQQGGVNKYRPGAGIGWHKDKPEFGVIVGVSLLAPATMRFRRPKENGWMRISQILKPRSIYILEGESRTLWNTAFPP
jgi:alkylated DNA repair dioxygenase AlkB